jgi:hypothetical protein
MAQRFITNPRNSNVQAGKPSRGRKPESALTKALNSILDSKDSSASSQKVVDSRPPDAVESTQTTSSEGTPSELPAASPAITSEKMMTLTLKGTSKNGKTAFYSGAAQTVRLQVGLFEGGTAPGSISVPDGVFAAQRPKLSKEERKAAKAAAPKPTLAEKIAKREAALARLRQKAQAEASQPSL